jgi:hypothetical protein
VILHNAPPTHWQTIAVALLIDAILVFVLVMSLLAIRAHRLDQTEEDA